MRAVGAILRVRFDGFQNRLRALPAAVGAHRWCYSIRRMRFPISILYWSKAYPVSEIIADKVQNSTFFHTTSVFLRRSFYDSRILRTIKVGFGKQVAKTPIYPCIEDVHFVLRSVITIHQRYRWTDMTDFMLVAEALSRWNKLFNIRVFYFKRETWS